MLMCDVTSALSGSLELPYFDDLLKETVVHRHHCNDGFKIATNKFVYQFAVPNARTRCRKVIVPAAGGVVSTTNFLAPVSS